MSAITRSSPIVVLVLGGALAACGGGDDGSAMPDGPILRPDSENDIDFDGVPNDMDNCPASSNAFQGNEDADKFGDACDPCPTVKDDNPADGDGDGVANDCDPEPIMFGDKIAFFEGFHQGAPQAWDKTGTSTPNNDQPVAPAPGPGRPRDCV